jgi:ABC-2 type transport system permease protein
VIDVLRSEWIKVRTVRAHWVLTIIAVAFPVVVVALVGTFNPDPEIIEAQNLLDLITGVSVVSLLLLASLWVINLTSEFAHNTIRVTYAATPTRWKVIVAKAIVGTTVTTVLMAFTWVLAWLVGATLLTTRGGSVPLSQTDGPAAQVASLIALAVIVSWFALGLGALIRNSPAAVVVVLLWPLLIENLVALALGLAGVDGAAKWMPYQAAISAIGGSPGGPGADSLDRPWAQLYFAAWALGLLAAGVLVDRRRDA